MSSRQTVPPQVANPKHSAQTRPMNPTQRSLPIRIYPHGLLLLSPLLFVVTGAILLGLLGIFVTWLLIVAVLITAIVVSDLAQRSWRRLVNAHGRVLQHRTAGYP
jgi:Flp pilus assembly protein TadB